MSDQIAYLRHYGKYRDEEVIIIGYSPAQNDLLLVRVSALPVDEQADLRRIVASSAAQTRDVLVPLLETARHKSGESWFMVLGKHLRRNSGLVHRIPTKEVEILHPEQKAWIRGYGKSIEPHLNQGRQKRLPPADYQDSLTEAEKAPVGPAPVDYPVHREEFSSAIKMLAEQQAQTNAILANLVQNGMGKAVRPRSKRAPGRPRKAEKLD